MAFRLTERQAEAVPWLAGPERHKLIYGGARSGKTFFLVRAVLIRAVMAPKSRHLIAVMIRQILGSVAQFEKGLDPTVVPPAAISKKPPDSCLSRSKDTIEAGAFGISSVETGANLG